MILYKVIYFYHGICINNSQKKFKNSSSLLAWGIVSSSPKKILVLPFLLGSTLYIPQGKARYSKPQEKSVKLRTKIGIVT